jgi:hypothetical protein
MLAEAYEARNRAREKRARGGTSRPVRRVADRLGRQCELLGIHLTDADSEQQEDSVEAGPKTRS